MANIYDSYLRCISNPELIKLIDPEKIIQKTRSQFRFKRLDELVYETRWGTMHEDIILLSKKLPNDVFMVRYYDICVQEHVPAECYRYQDGRSIFLGYEPVYKFCGYTLHKEEMGEEIMLKLWFRVRDYLFRLDHTKESLIDGKHYYVDMLEDHYDNCISSSVTVHAELDNYKLTVDKTKGAELHFREFKRDSKSSEWIEILPEAKNNLISRQ